MAHDNNAPKGWKNLDDFRDGLKVYLPEASSELIDTTHSFTFDDLTLSLTVDSDVSTVLFNGEERPAKVTVYNVADKTHFLGCQFLEPENEDITVMFNTETFRALAIHAIARTEPVPGECRVVQDYKVGTLDGGLPSGFIPAPTKDLTGQRLLIIYSENHYYEQIFLNSGRYCWHNLKGEQYGHAAAETCTYYKFADNLYMYSWREMLIPCGTTYFLNYDTNVATGKFIGWTGDNEISQTYAGGEMQILSTTYYPKECQPL